MTWQPTVFAIPMLLAAGVAVVLGLYTGWIAHTRGSDRIVTIFGLIAVATVLWVGGSALKLLHTDPATKLLFYRILHIGAMLLPALFVLFVAAYTDRDRWFRPAVIGVLFAIPLGIIVLLFFEPPSLMIADVRVVENGLVILRVTDGPAFFVSILYSFGLTVAALGLVGYEAHQIGSAYYPQAGLLAVGVLAPILISVLTIAELPPFLPDRPNFVPISGVISTSAMGIAILRYRLFRLPPMAYTTAMRYSPDAMFVLDHTGRIVHANPSGEELLTASDSAIGDQLTAILPAFGSDTETGDRFEIESADGGSKVFEAVVDPLTRGGSHVGRVVVLRDVTERQRQRERLKRQAERLDAFASTVSHDLRNPLSVAQGYLQMIDTDDPETVEMIETIERSHDRIADIIDDLLMLSRQGRRIDEFEAVSLAEITTLSWAGVNTAAATVEATIDDDQTIQADPAMLQHVFENLFRNSVEHGGSGVHVRVGWLKDGSGFYVEDSGPGIDPDDREAVLEPGYTTSDDGTGYGLEIVRSIVEAHGWELAIEEGEAGGARFEIWGVQTQ